MSSGAEGLGETMMAGWDSLMKQFLTSWLNVGLLVSLEGDSVTWLTDQLQNLSIFFAIIGIMIAGLWTMLHFRGDQAIKVAKSLMTVMLVTTLGTALVQVTLRAGDAFSDWVLASAGVTVEGVGNLATAGATVSMMGPGLAILAGLFGIIATAIQWMIMLVRATVLPLMVAVWPLAAGASMINGSEQAFSKLTKWMVAFILYKPVAAVIYAFAWRLKSGDEGLGGVLNGLLLLVLAIVALPALMRLISPGSSVLGGAAGGSLALAGGAALGAAAVSAGTAIMTGGGSAAASTAGGTASTTAKTAPVTPGGTKGGPGGGGETPGGGGGGGGGAGTGGGGDATANGTSKTPSTLDGGSGTPSAPSGGTNLPGDASDQGSESASTAPGTSGVSDAVGGAGGTSQGGAGSAFAESSPAAEGTSAASNGPVAGASAAGSQTPAAQGTPVTDGATPSAGGTASTAQGSSVADSGASAAQGTPAADGTAPQSGSATALAQSPAPAPRNTNSTTSKGGAAARAGAERLAHSVADGTKDVNGEDVIGG